MFRLAGHLHKTVAELLSQCDSRELSQWLAYDKAFGLHDPHWGPARISLTLAQVNGARNVKLSDFYPRQEPKRKQTPAEMREAFHMFALAHNARAKQEKA